MPQQDVRRWLWHGIGSEIRSRSLGRRRFDVLRERRRRRGVPRLSKDVGGMTKTSGVSATPSWRLGNETAEDHAASTWAKVNRSNRQAIGSYVV